MAVLINELRSEIVNNCTRESAMARGQRVLNNTTEDKITMALVYLGDSIREACGDIGPHLKDGLDKVSVELGSLATATGDIGR